MKPTFLLLAASLIANIAFLAVFATRSAPPAKSPPSPAQESAAGLAHTGPTDALRAALASGDVRALEAAGLSPELARELALGRTFARLAEKWRAAQAKPADDRWWRTRPGGNPGAREQQLVNRRELSDALIAAFGDDLGLSGGDAPQLAFLPAEKRDALRRIVQDYDEMMAKFSAPGGIQLASDREKLRLLRLERERDIAALLTPEERLAYDMRMSPSGQLVRNRYGSAIESETEFAKIYALQKAFDEKFPREALTGRISPDVLRARADAERQLTADIRAAVGDDRYADLRRAADGDYRTLDSLTQRLNLPPSTTDTVLSSRESFSAASQRIANDSSLPMPERRAQIQELANQAKTELTRTLGTEAADAYAQRSPWMSMLQSGMAYSTTPPENSSGPFLSSGQSVYPVIPAGAGGAGAQRQFVFSAAAGDAAPAGDTVFSAGPTPGTLQLSIATSTTTERTPPPAAPQPPATPSPLNSTTTPATPRR